ncbi:TetR family transcriptional regulator [Prauserella marina]|uniref:DNA-binding transcriptional regulator, AcrR family n=1 Tax=Prauserella marina TaxID=530584 RepID=A0A222VRA1_9PSEU|nr:TetR/AcrR family transcriptional regulator [Prauserella marina]ASR36465.1 TetR family transcriptional regulator [Prauserella marina]PWV73832.1 TetR family transcriptional regulator [Prauserella marina]SDD57044.1 DNA-binding transcriptional regulator, AcrR family [Prauserella marina]
MSVNKEFGAGLGLTVTEEARRAQIIEATIDTIAELGYGNTSFARIVERAGLSSTRMISYHFGNKDELMMATVGAIVDNQDTFLQKRIGAETERTAMLRAYIESEVAFLGEYPRQAQALMDIGANARSADGTPMFELVWKSVRFGRIERQLQQGQREGAFGEFDVSVLALVIRQAIDGVAARLAREPDLDLQSYGRELAELFTKATKP